MREVDGELERLKAPPVGASDPAQREQDLLAKLNRLRYLIWEARRKGE